MGALATLGAILAAVFVTAAAVAPFRSLAARFGWIAHPRPDRHHQTPIPLLGGAAAVAGVASGLAVYLLASPAASPAPGAGPSSYAGAILAGAVALFILGIADDRRPLAALPKALAQGGILAVVLLLWRPEGRLHEPGVLLAAWAGGMLVLNAWNYIDHVDGVFSGVLAVSATLMALAGGVAVREGYWLGTYWALAGAALGFLLWNLPPARIFLGDGGSLSLGFLVVGGSWVLLDRGERIALPVALAASAVPLADLLMVSAARIRAGNNPFCGGREHTGHRLTARFGPIAAFLIPVAAAALFGVAALVLGLRRSEAAAIVIALGIALLAWIVGRVPLPFPRREPRSDGPGTRSARPRGGRSV